MAYPQTIVATLVECAGVTCSNPAGVLVYDESSGYPEYLNDSGDFIYARCEQIDLGGDNYTWQLKVRYMGSPCRGIWTFRLQNPVDHPTGNYCRYTGGAVDCTQGKATVVNGD
jgi:hypothetical protein